MFYKREQNIISLKKYIMNHKSWVSFLSKYKSLIMLYRENKILLLLFVAVQVKFHYKLLINYIFMKKDKTKNIIYI